MPSHRAEAQPLRRPRKNRSRSSSGWTHGRPNASLSAPKVGIAGVLGIATIAAPISGAMAGSAPKAVSNPIAALPAAPAPAVPALPSHAGVGVVALQVIPASSLTSTVPVTLAAPRTVVVSRASRAGERPALPGCSGIPRITAAPNGQLPANTLCTLWTPKHRLRADAAVALAKLNIAYKMHFGDDICLTDSYRTYSEQVRLKSIKPGLAATPGTSNHGLGLAVDLCDGVEKGSGSRFQWLRANAAAYGWENPDWAHVGGGGPYEPWHWEYVAGETAAQK